jgi:hypothetical protein
MHVALEHLGPSLLGPKAAPFSITMPAMALVARTVLGAHSFVFPVSLAVCRKLDGSARVAWSEM